MLSPFVSFWLLVFFGPKLGKPLAGWVCVVLGMGVPLVLGTYVMLEWRGETAEATKALTQAASQWQFHWANLGSVPITIGVKLDSLTVAMYFMITFIAFWIFVFSVGYMAGHSDEVAGKSKYHRFFAYLSLFAFSMLGLVISSSLFFLFVFWELVGLCSYLLIGYYFDKPFASRAAMKAFVTNRVGDFGFLIGLMLVYFQLGTLDLDQAAANFATQYAAFTSGDLASAGIFASNYTFLGWSLATIMGVGLFFGAMGKSAQFPLHVWLPDAMAGPTPVSALIHAATMVAAGVYLVARVYRLMTPDALMFVAGIGCITLTLMALVAMVQTDIKKCLAYSTLSQLGYMIFGLGCGAWIAALFHLITHAFFKAMMFLGSGQVIEGCHHEQDMRKMGGLWRKMPVTCITFLIGVLAISGTGIPGTDFGIGGFFSKDEILAVAYSRSHEWEDGDYHKYEAHGNDSHAENDVTVTLTARLASDRLQHETQESEAKAHAATTHGSDAHADSAAHSEHAGSQDLAGIFGNTKPLPKWMFWLAIITAYVTPFYMMRCWWMTFMGKPRDEHVYDHAHESFLMYAPLAVLAVGTLVASYWIFRPLIADAAPAATAAPMVMALDGHANTEAVHNAHHWLVTGVGFAFLIGFGLAFMIYRKGLALAGSIKRAAGPVCIVLEHKYFIDELYDFVWVKGCLLVAKVARFIDTWIVDLFVNQLAAVVERIAAFMGLIVDKHGVDGVVNGIASSSMDFSNIIRKPQTGHIRHYVLFATAVAAFVLLCVLYFDGGSPDVVATTASAAAINLGLAP